MSAFSLDTSGADLWRGLVAAFGGLNLPQKITVISLAITVIFQCVTLVFLTLSIIEIRRRRY